MLFYIHYNRSFNDTLFKFWLNHYCLLKIPYGIYVEFEDLPFFLVNYPNSKNILYSVPNNLTKITEKDFLMSYTKDENDTMILSYTLDAKELQKENNTIGRVFSVPIKNKIMYTTFEIPDFIIHKHKDHTNYTVDGIKIKHSDDKDIIKTISSSVVSLNMDISKVAYDLQYYETNILVNSCSINKKDPLFFNNKYENTIFNILTNKEKQYAIVWYSKCACTTITDIFAKVNNIDFNKLNSKISLSWAFNKYKYNVYLQNMDIICFVRNPYERFISSYIDKHVYKNDHIYITLRGYNEFVNTSSYNNNMYDLCKFLFSGGVISSHYALYTKSNDSIPYFKLLKKKYVKIEHDLNKNLYDFLKKYHNDMDDLNFDYLNYYTNTIVYKQKQIKIDNQNSELIKELKYFTPEKWSEYLSKYNLNYKNIIENDPELKNLIYSLYEADFLEFNYTK
jgi:hypothetical protein